MDPAPLNRARYKWLWIALGAVLTLALIPAVWISAKWPFSEKAVTAALEESFGGRVEVHNFRTTYFPPGAAADNVKLFRPERQPQPMVQVDHMSVRGSYAGMWKVPKHIEELRIQGLHLLVEPTDPHASPVRPPDRSTLIIDKVVADDSTLRFASRKPGNEPFEVAIRHLVLHNAHSQRAPLDFQAVLAINEPAGEIHASGKLGPWNHNDVAATPARGEYSLEGARLDVFSGLAGMLDGKGTFDGTLGQLRTAGDVNIPNFRLQRSSHTVPLSSHFEASVDALNGDTTLTSVSTRLFHTTVMSQGSVSREPTAHHGKTVDLRTSMQSGLVNEVMLVFIKAKVAPMTGSMQAKTVVRLEPGPAPFLKRLYLNGDFHISHAEFTKEARQVTIDKLSASATGAKTRSGDDPGQVLSDLQGHCIAKDGVATLTNVTFQFPGGTARVRGTFDLITEQINFQGDLQTEGELSDTQKGVKKLFVKVVVALHKHRSSIHAIPFKITGAYGDPNFALNDDPRYRKRN